MMPCVAEEYNEYLSSNSILDHQILFFRDITLPVEENINVAELVFMDTIRCNLHSLRYSINSTMDCYEIHKEVIHLNIDIILNTTKWSKSVTEKEKEKIINLALYTPEYFL